MNKPAICKACGKLMGTSDVCPYCGTKRQSLSANVIYLKRSLSTESISFYKLILKITIAMYVIEILVGAFLFKSGLFNVIFSGPPGQALLMLGASSPYVYKLGHWWGPFTATFLHGGLMHIGFNMFALSQIGPLMEHATSRSFFLFTYIITGACGFLLSAYGGSLSVGGSAGLYGLIGCGIVISFILGAGKEDPLFRGLLSWLIYGFIFALLIPGIDHLAHIGGLIGGLATGYLWTKLRTEPWFRGFINKFSIFLLVTTGVAFIHCLITFLG